MSAIQPLTPAKNDARGLIYDCYPIKWIERHKGSISADHSHQRPEILYLMKGEIELTIDQSVTKIHAPVKISIEPNQYHKVLALTNIILIEAEPGHNQQIHS